MSGHAFTPTREMAQGAAQKAADAYAAARQAAARIPGLENEIAELRTEIGRLAIRLDQIAAAPAAAKPMKRRAA